MSKEGVLRSSAACRSGGRSRSFTGPIPTTGSPGANPSPLRAVREEKAQATAEFAMVLPFLLLIFLLFAQAVMVMRAQIAVTAAAREGARKGVETGNIALIEGAAARAAAGLDQDRLRVAVASGPRRRGEWISVEVEYDVPLAIPALAKFFPEVTVRGRAEMRIENDREGT